MPRQPLGAIKFPLLMTMKMIPFPSLYDMISPNMTSSSDLSSSGVGGDDELDNPWLLLPNMT